MPGRPTVKGLHLRPPGRPSKRRRTAAPSLSVTVTAGGTVTNYPILLGNSLATPTSRALSGGIGLHPNYSKLNTLPDFVPVLVRQPSDNTHIVLGQRDHIQPKTGRRVQTRRFPIRDSTIRRAQRVCRPRGNQTQDHVRPMALIDGRGQNHGRSRLRDPGAWEGCNYDVSRPQAPVRSRSSNADKDARCASARSASVQASDQSTRAPFARSRSRVVQVIT